VKAGVIPIRPTACADSRLLAITGLDDPGFGEPHRPRAGFQQLRRVEEPAGNGAHVFGVGFDVARQGRLILREHAIASISTHKRAFHS
jgi:hypothetical protein